MRFSSIVLTCAMVVVAASPARAADKPATTWEPAASDHYTHGRFGHKIDMVVIHTVEGSQKSAVNWFRISQPPVSAHYIVGKDGSIVQCVADADMAWHAGGVNAHSIGIEHEGYDGRPQTWTDSMYASSAKLTRWLCDTYKIPMDRQHIVGHNEVPGQTHGDPGKYFDWARYMDLVRGATPAATGTGVAPTSSSSNGAGNGATGAGNGATGAGNGASGASNGATGTGTVPATTAPISSLVAHLPIHIPANLLRQLVRPNGAPTTTGTSPVTSATTPVVGKNPADEGLPLPISVPGTNTTPTSGTGTAPVASTIACTAMPGTIGPASSGSTTNDPGALSQGEITGMVATLDRAFQALEHTIAAVESELATNPATPTTPATPGTTPSPAPSTTPATHQDEPLCRNGSTGRAVTRIQHLLGISEDGIYGPQTEAAVRAFQQSHGCRVDGIVGPETWAALDRMNGTPVATGAGSSGTGSHGSSGTGSHGSSTPAPGTPSTPASDDGLPPPAPTTGGSSDTGGVCQQGDVTTQQGESLASIAARLGVTEDALAAANPQINQSGELPAGTVVHMPASSNP